MPYCDDCANLDTLYADEPCFSCNGSNSNFSPSRLYTFSQLSEVEQTLVLSLLEQAQKLRKVCPNEEECRDGYIPERCSEGNKECIGSGLIPVTAEDVEMRLK